MIRRNDAVELLLFISYDCESSALFYVCRATPGSERSVEDFKINIEIDIVGVVLLMLTLDGLLLFMRHTWMQLIVL